MAYVPSTQSFWQFVLLCARTALKTKITSFASDWTWFTGTPIVLTGLYYVGWTHRGDQEMIVHGYPILDVMAFGLCVFVVTWVVGFVVRTVRATHTVYVEQLNRASGLEIELNGLKSKKTWTDALVPISDKTYTNEEVEIDGKAFYRCVFTNATFTFHGTGPSAFHQCTLNGTGMIITDDPAATACLALFGALRNQFPTLKIGAKHKVSGQIKIIG
jgi:hypothetical protein